MTSDDAENIDFLENCKLTLKEGEEKHYLPLIYSNLCVSFVFADITLELFIFFVHLI